MEKHDEDFLKGVSERLEGFYPGLSERIDRLNEEQLGRAIVLKPIGQQQSQLVGYILPVDKNQSEHVILFKTGDVLVTRAKQPIPGDLTPVRDIYRQSTSPSEEPIVFSAVTRSSELIQALMGGTNFLTAEVTSRNNSSSKLHLILEKVDQAISTASETKADHDRAKKESTESIINKGLDNFRAIFL